MAAFACLPQSSNAQETISKEPQFDGKWWMRADTNERSGFINGSADCLTWTAHESGFNGTPEQLISNISNFYKTHTSNLPVLEVWRLLQGRSIAKDTTKSDGETWTNPHWYMDGYWWQEGTDAEHQGFMEGYLWCVANRVHGSSDSYSKHPSFYVEKVNNFVRSNPKLNRESVAVTLRRFRDKPKS